MRATAARITLNRPAERNALSLELMEELIAALRGLGAVAETRTIVIEGAGPAFSAWHDLSEMVGRERLFDTCAVMMETIHELPQPVIAKVHGMATAAGCQLVAACDLAVTAEGARSSPLTVGIGKEAFYGQVELDEHRAYELTKSVMATNSLADDAQEGICAFLEKRPPTWKGQ